MNLIQSLKNKSALALERAWYEDRSLLTLAMLPFSFMYQLIVCVRRALYQCNILKSSTIKTPLIVVGNILVGGTGKTPTVIALCNYLSAQSLKVGVVTRGYMGQCAQYPHHVSDSDVATTTGDEALLIKYATQADVVVDPNRLRGIESLIAQGNPDVIIMDDGLQHYKITPGLSIALHPSAQSFAPYCLPAGPLREPVSRLAAFDVVVNDLKLSPENRLLIESNRPLTAMTAIAKPKRFTDMLKSMSINAEPILFRDHHQFTESDFEGVSGDIIMTEKDWVKCRSLNISQTVHVLKVKAILPDNVKTALCNYLGLN